MIITPLARQAPKPVALLVPGFRTLTVHAAHGTFTAAGPQRCYDLLTTFEDHVLYVAASLRGLVHATGATAWQADLWKGRPTTMYLVGSKVKVTSLRRTLNAVTDGSDQFAALLEVIEWLAHQGVKAGSLSSMAWQLWRSTLPTSVEIGFDAKVGRAAFYGGRQEASASPIFDHVDQVALDLSSAYLHSMMDRPYAGLLREVSNTTTLDPEVSGLARVRVTVPDDLRFAPLPVRVAPDLIQWRYGEFEGTWTWTELHAAGVIGCRVEVRRCWAPATEITPFDAWGRLCFAGRRDVSPEAAPLLKSIINTLWGCFAMTGDDRGSVRFLDEYGDETESVERRVHNMPQANTVVIASETTSRVRVRLLLEGLYGDDNPEGDPIHVDTDGMIVSAASAARRRQGLGIGEWREKEQMTHVQVRAPQVFRFQRPGSDVWHYKASGVPTQLARDLFVDHPGFQISFAGLDAVIPAGRALTLEQIRRYEQASDTLNRMVYGPTLEPAEGER